MTTPQDGTTMGVEEEFFLVDTTGALVSTAPETVEESDAPGADLKTELMRCQVESATGICRSAAEVHTELVELRARLAAGASTHGARLVPMGCVAHDQPTLPPVGPGHRYHRIAEYYGPIVFGDLTCGCHVHVGVADQETAVQVVNHLRPWLPTLLALAANSPFHNGRDTGYASTRHLLWNRWPTAGPPPYLESAAHYRSMLDRLMDSGAALDRRMIYWDVRPSETQPTVEIRIGDVAATAADAALLAVIIRFLVVDALTSIDAGTAAPHTPHELIRAGLWRAAKEGVTGRCPNPWDGTLANPLDTIDRLLLGHRDTQDADFAAEGVDRLRADGGGADRQRAAGGPDQAVHWLSEHALDTDQGA